MKTITAGYAAGFFDGEGTVTAVARRRRSNSSPTLLVCISNTDREVLAMLREKWGGSLTTRKNTRPRCKQVYQWVLCSIGARSFLKTIRPYVVIKKDVVEAALEYSDIMLWPRKRKFRQVTVYRRGRNWTAPEPLPEYRSRVVEVWRKIREINKRGAPTSASRIPEDPFGPL